MTATAVLRALLRNPAESLRVRVYGHDLPELVVLAVTHDADGPILTVGENQDTAGQEGLW